MNIHFIAIGGSIMHNLAIALSLKGHHITGSDDEVYDPARSALLKHQLLPHTMGWAARRIHTDLDYVILGMHAKRDNPELVRAKNLGISIVSFPEYLYQSSKDKKRVVVAGSHGKTTTTSMIMHALHYHGYDFDYAVGARLEGFDQMVRLSDAPVIIIEGDEYLSSAIDRRPKFMHYHPHLTIITGIAWDHINVFKKERDYLEVFEKYIESLPSDSILYAFSEDSVLAKMIAKSDTKSTVITYDGYKGIINPVGEQVQDQEGNTYNLKIFGNHNLQNMEAAFLVCKELGMSESDFLQSMKSFTGASKRLEEKASGHSSKMFIDFAHAPSKVRATVAAIRKRFKNKKIVACLELHTYSSINKDFIPHYAATLSDADEAIVYFSEHTLEIKRLPPITTDEIIINFRHPNIRVFTQKADLENYLLFHGWENTILLMMSSGVFGGLDFATLRNQFIAV